MESFPEMTNKVTTLVRATGIEDPGRMSGAATERPDPEVPERARRRTFTAKYKLEILAAYDAAPDGEKGALLRREGLSSSPFVVNVHPNLHALLQTLSESAHTEPRSTP